ncbi:MAG: glycosyl hydrolase family 8 [Anaerolineaceae bacterium]|nr:glycosyl hydrolase family 8 [Anaerolineaceae bacterium]
MAAELISTILLLFILIASAAILIMSIKKDRVKKELPQQDPPRLPFPQHVSFITGSLQPDQISQEEQDKVVIENYQAWKSAFVLADAEPARSFLRMGVEKHLLRFRLLVSAEGQGYAMLISVLMAGADPDAQATFDRLYAFCRAHPSKANPALMSWQVSPDAFPSRALGSSSQADLLIAYSLLMADRQWSSEGRVNYRNRALNIIQALKDQCIHPEENCVLPGNWVEDQSPEVATGTRPVDFAPLIFNAFYQETKDPIWKDVSAQMKVFLKKASKFGQDALLLPPEMINIAKLEQKQAQDNANNETFTSVPAALLMHLSLAALLNGDKDASAFLEGINRWIINACDGDAGRIKSCYTLQGEEASNEKDLALSALLGMAAVHPSSTQSWLNSLWDELTKESEPPNDPLTSTLRLMAMILISRNWWKLQDRRG